MVEQIPPFSRNPTNNGSLIGTFKVAFEKFLQGIDDMLPGQVVGYNRTSNLAQIQPLISVVTTTQNIIQRAQVMSVPVLQLGGGGFVLNFPVKSGDLGFIKANDRDISLFKQTWQTSIPNTARKHDFADAIFIPACLTGLTIAGSDTNNVVLQSLDGTIRLSMGLGVCISDQVGYAQSNNAILDLQSTTKAFKFPAMTTTQKNGIASPLAGFTVYDSTLGRLSTYNGATWS